MALVPGMFHIPICTFQGIAEHFCNVEIIFQLSYLFLVYLDLGGSEWLGVGW